MAEAPRVLRPRYRLRLTTALTAVLTLLLLPKEAPLWLRIVLVAIAVLFFAATIAGLLGRIAHAAIKEGARITPQQKGMGMGMGIHPEGDAGKESSVEERIPSVDAPCEGKRSRRDDASRLEGTTGRGVGANTDHPLEADPHRQAGSPPDRRIEAEHLRHVSDPALAPYVEGLQILAGLEMDDDLKMEAAADLGGRYRRRQTGTEDTPSGDTTPAPERTQRGSGTTARGHRQEGNDAEPSSSDGKSN
jgi:hypothetical protein